MSSLHELPDCFECEEELEEIKRGEKENFGECPECGRKMEYHEWQQLNRWYDKLNEIVDDVMEEMPSNEIEPEESP